ncbi:glycerol-3-phosphate 1-O-acyltransferase [Hwanghaeella grinnelliae]|uniref:Glycerol-3-phosphate acyltransferase n=1 Tax=Hwanghaeella grinnelliae TaxID=2500179 RepID=A0A3S2VRJ9_9PROT|nr:glycerol-3-phosphate 1-O-acyltransferase PlsY [Hwanghaeella grinnelliae]RVU38797.1 glycerol-3-phosphate 1-O-acyltransferase [Hwanghaeella grinnelliae]
MDGSFPPIEIAALAIAGGYLFGSIPFGLVLTRLAGLGDIRDIGSGSIGATNVLRTGNKPLAAATLVLDSGKGAIAVVIAMMLAGPTVGILAGVAAVFGHNFPIWLRFKGGKGVATTFGVLIAIAPLVALGAGLVWLLVAVVTRYSSAAALTAGLAAPLIAWALGLTDITVASAVLAALGWIRHHQNIGRLIAGEESKISFKRKG